MHFTSIHRMKIRFYVQCQGQPRNHVVTDEFHLMLSCCLMKNLVKHLFWIFRLCKGSYSCHHIWALLPLPASSLKTLGASPETILKLRANTGKNNSKWGNYIFQIIAWCTSAILLIMLLSLGTDTWMLKPMHLQAVRIMRRHPYFKGPQGKNSFDWCKFSELQCAVG